MKRIVILLILIFLISGCSNNIEESEDYNFIESLNVFCKVPNYLIDEINNSDWEEQNKSIIRGYPCEAISEECTAETYFFKYNENLLIYRWHYFGVPDDTYYLKYNNKEYNCLSTEQEKRFCSSDSDCVPASCCHASETINQEYAPNCENIDCTEECNGPLDCGCGKPICYKNKCGIKKVKSDEECPYPYY